MKLAELKKLGTKELTKQLTQKREELAKLRISYRTEETKNVRQIRIIRKDIAKIMTLQNQAKSEEKSDV